MKLYTIRWHTDGHHWIGYQAEGRRGPALWPRRLEKGEDILRAIHEYGWAKPHLERGGARAERAKRLINYGGQDQ